MRWASESPWPATEPRSKRRQKRLLVQCTPTAGLLKRTGCLGTWRHNIPRLALNALGRLGRFLTRTQGVFRNNEYVSYKLGPITSLHSMSKLPTPSPCHPPRDRPRDRRMTTQFLFIA